MISLTVLYPKTTDSTFDLDYYLSLHATLIRERLTPLGLTSFDVETGLAGGAPDTPPAYAVIGRLNFATIDDLQAALGTHGPELIADIPNFTDAQPVMQINQLL